MKRVVRKIVDRVLGSVGTKIVSTGWGPRGFAAKLQRARQQHQVEIKTVIDVGAAKGEWTRECLTVLPDANYLMIDPLLENEASLQAVCQEKQNVKYWLGAAGAEQSELAFKVAGDQSSFFDGVLDNVIKRTVQVRTLDSFVEDGTVPQPDFIKADVQGYEMNVVRGGAQILKRAKLVLLETSIQNFYQGGATIEEVVSLMHERGFGVYDFCSYFVMRSGGDLLQADLMFAPRPSAVFSLKL